MTRRVVLLDVLKLRRVVESRHVPVQLPNPFVQRWIARSDLAEVALEVLVVYCIEANDGGVETDIGFGD